MSSDQLAVSFACTPVRETHFSAERSPTEAVVETVADLEGVGPTDLPPLYESVDSDALDRLVDHHGGTSDGTMAVCFTFAGWNVFVRGDGSIVVGDPDRMSEQTPLF